ncbi:MAG TPA: enoyl-CoA hydratase [Dehalococcoidia bacterium]
MAEQPILVDVTDGVGLITLNRPDRLNALTGPMWGELADAAERLAADAAVRCVVLTGAGRAFCAGGDVKAMAEGEGAGGGFSSFEEGVAAQRRWHRVSALLHTMPKPTIAMVNGAAAGAGLSVALACDLRIAGESARLGTAFARVGLAGDFGGTYFLTKLAGPARARELYFTAEILDARRALELGLVNRVVPDEQLREVTLELARQLAAGPTVAYASMKHNLTLAESGTLQEVLDSEAELHRRSGLTRDHREAARAFAEKRQPTFEGR